MSPIQSVLNAAARLLARLHRASHIYGFMLDYLHWLPFFALVQLRILTLIYRSHIGQAPRYLRVLVCLLLPSLFVRHV